MILLCDVGQSQFNVEATLSNQRRINDDMNNVRQCQNNVVIFNVEFHNVWQCQNNVVNMTFSKRTN